MINFLKRYQQFLLSTRASYFKLSNKIIYIKHILFTYVYTQEHRCQAPQLRLNTLPQLYIRGYDTCHPYSEKESVHSPIKDLALVLYSKFGLNGKVISPDGVPSFAMRPYFCAVI